MEECKDFREQLSLYIDGMLDGKESRLLEEHIKACEDCRRELGLLRETVQSCRNLEEKEPPEYLCPMISSALRRTRKGTAASHIRKKWLKPGLVSVAAVLLLAIAAKGIIPGLFTGYRTAQDMAATDAAPAEEMYNLAGSEEFGFSSEQKKRGMEYDGQADDAAGILSEPEMQSGREMGTAEEMPPAPEPGNLTAETGDNLLTAQDSRKIIRNAELSIEVEDFNRQYDAIQRMVDETGGYIESSNSYVRKYGSAEDGRDFTEGHVVIRIPSSEFTNCLEGISTLGKVTNRSTDGSDITLQYMDTEVRLKSMQIQQERLLEIMEKATLVEDILNIENELNRVRTEIESYGTQLRGWDNLVQYSTIRIFMTEVDDKDTQVTALQMGSLWDRMKRGIIRTTNAIMDMVEMIIVGIGYALPVAILLGAGLLVWWRIKRKNTQ
jgi:hypothetical protein